MSEIKSDKLIIFAHGFTGHSNEHIFYNAARFFPQNGFDTFRFNFYDYKPEARKFTDTTIVEHAEDLNTVIQQFEAGYKNIYLIGHSLGALVILLANSNIPKITRVVLWEPSREPSVFLGECGYVKSLDVYLEESNVDILVGKRFVEDARNLPSIKSLVEKCEKPIKIIGAENAGGEKIGKDLYYTNAKTPKDFYLIRNSGHTFNQQGAEEELFKETLQWIKLK